MKVLFSMIIVIYISINLLGAIEPHFVTDPAISPDGTKVCFVFKNDLWLVPFNGGNATRLTSTDANEYGPCWSPDGSQIAFTSNRNGQQLVYIIPSTGGESRQLFRESMSVCDWYSDGNSLLCAKSSINWGTSLFKAGLDKSKPVLVSEIGDYHCCLSPDNKRILFTRNGDPYREAYRGSANGDIYEYNMDSNLYTQLTVTDYTERYPRYSYSGNTIYFSASDGKRYQLYKATPGKLETKEQITRFDTWSVRDISIAQQNDNMVFELFDSIWCYCPAKKDNNVYKLDIHINEDIWENYDKQETVIDYYDKFSVSDDELLLAFSYKYDLFVMPRKGGDVKQLTNSQCGIEDIAFLPDNKTIVFSQYQNGIKSLFSATVDSIMAVNPVHWYGEGRYNVDDFYKSSEHHWVIEYSDSLGGGNIAVTDSLFKNFRAIETKDPVVSDFLFSPDGTMALYMSMNDDIYLRQLYLYDYVTNIHKRVLNDENPLYGFQWLPNQKAILFGKYDQQRTINRLDLVTRDEFELDKDNWKEILNKSKMAIDTTKTTQDELKPTGKTKDLIKDNPRLRFTDIDWLDIDHRIYPIISDAELIYAVKAIDDTSFYYVRDISGKDGKSTLSKINIMGKYGSEVSQLPVNPTYQFINNYQMYYKDSNKLKVLNLKSKAKSDISNKFKYEYDLHTLNERVFEQVWGLFGKGFYDPKMHNTDWNAIYKLYKPYTQYADTPGILSSIIDEMIGDINASHTGYYPRTDIVYPYKQIASLGLEFNERKITDNGIEISRIYPGTRLYNFYGVREGDTLLSVNGANITPYVSLDSLLVDKTDKKIDLVIQHNNKRIEASIMGISWSANRSLWFQDKVDRAKKMTSSLSNDRIGYVMIPRMNDNEYTKFLHILFSENADKQALIIDIRGNGGGHIHEDLMTFLENKPNALNTSRFYGAQKRETPKRTWTKPIVLLIDEYSFSDAEIFPQLFKEAKLGTVIGMPTSGSVIGTWEINLIDGSSMRMPGSGWFRLDGTNMEGNGAQPDIRVEMSLNDQVKNNDLQLKKAIEVLLEQIK